MRTCVVVPTLNAGRLLPAFFAALKAQARQPDEVIVIDSESTDDTVEICRRGGARVVPIWRRQFNHGGTRQYASQLANADVLVYMTQDAILEGAGSLGALVDALSLEPGIGMAYGRQLPHKDATLIAVHHRMFNYPPVSETRNLGDVSRLGSRACFCSDSFAAYKVEVLRSVGGFPKDVISMEDAWVAARMLLAGYAVRYEATALVRHSHDYGFSENLRRYFDFGVFFSEEPWILQRFGAPSSEGRRFVLSEINYLRAHGHAALVPAAIVHSLFKWVGFKLGLRQKILPIRVKMRLGMFRAYWRRDAGPIQEGS